MSQLKSNGIFVAVPARRIGEFDTLLKTKKL